MTARALLAEARESTIAHECKYVPSTVCLACRIDAYLAQPDSEAAKIRTLRNAAVTATERAERAEAEIRNWRRHADHLVIERDQWHAAYQRALDPLVRAKMMEPPPPIVMPVEQFNAARGEPREGEG